MSRYNCISGKQEIIYIPGTILFLFLTSASKTSETRIYSTNSTLTNFLCALHACNMYNPDNKCMSIRNRNFLCMNTICSVRSGSGILFSGFLFLSLAFSHPII